MTEDGSIDRLRSQHSYLDGRTAQLVSQKGTVRGIRNRVRSSIFRHQCQQKVSLIKNILEGHSLRHEHPPPVAQTSSTCLFVS